MTERRPFGVGGRAEGAAEASGGRSPGVVSAPTTARGPRQPGLIDPSVVAAPSREWPGADGLREAEPAAPMPVAAGAPDRGRSARGGTEPAGGSGDAAEVTAPRSAGASRWGRVFWLFLALVVAFLVYDTGRALVETIRSDWIGGTFLIALTLAFVAALGAATLAEWRALRRLGDVARVRETLANVRTDGSATRLRKALEPVLALVRVRRPDVVKAFGQRTQGLTDADAVMKQFRGAVLAPLDQEARRTVRANALAVMGATAVSPHPALDVIIVLWRSTLMVRRVAEVYGLRPSPVTTLALTKRVLVNAAVAVAADPTGDLVATTLGGGLAEKISARFAEGSISGLRALRLGARAIETCRPVPFEPDERKGMWHTLMQG